MNGRQRMALVVALSLVAVARVRAQESPEAAARRAAESWLSRVDGGNYAQSWDEASPSLQAQISKEQWVAALRDVHAQAGRVKSRKLASADHVKDPPSAPPGEYVTLRYDSAAEKMSSVAETVAAVLGKDGTWRVAGYFVKPPK